MRFHHIDSELGATECLRHKAPDTRTLDEASLETIRLVDQVPGGQGIYIWLDLDDGRQLKAGDRIDDFAEISKGKSSADLRGYSYVNASIQEAMERFNEAFVNHLNRFTGLRYKDDPAIVSMLITNENDVTHHFANVLLPDKNVPNADSVYMAQADSFAAQTGLSKNDVWKSW